VKLNNFEKIIGSGFYSGYSPIAPGTAGSFVALLIYLIPGFSNPVFMIASIIAVTWLGVHISGRFEEVYGKDPGFCVIDEFVGTWISFLFLPKTIWVIGSAFILWRIMDIVKPFPANKFEKISGGWGIMLDDIAAGIYTLIIMHIVLYFIN